MRHVVLTAALSAALYVLWGLSHPGPLVSDGPSDVVTSDTGRGTPRAAATQQGPTPSLSSVVGAQGSAGRPSNDWPEVRAPSGPPSLSPIGSPGVGAPLMDPPPRVERVEVWAPSRKEAQLRARGLMGLYSGWLGEAERLGWRASQDSLSISRDGVQIHFTSKDGMLQGAEVNLPPLALSDSVMDLWHTLLGDEGAYLNLQPPFEREERGWREVRSAQLPSGRTVELTLTGRTQGERPYGPERVTLAITALKR